MDPVEEGEEAMKMTNCCQIDSVYVFHVKQNTFKAKRKRLYKK